MKIKFLKDYAINRGACPLEIGGFVALETEIVKADTVVDLEKDNRDDAFSDELVRWLIDNGFAEEVKESGWWKPKNGEEYYVVSSHGMVGKATFYPENKLDCEAVSMGNCFKTEDAAERYRDYLKAIATVRQDEGVLTPEQINELEGKQGKAYHVGYMGKQNGEEVRLIVIDLYETWAPVGVILFDTGEHAQASLDNHSDEWKIIANYDWSRE